MSRSIFRNRHLDRTIIAGAGLWKVGDVLPDKAGRVKVVAVLRRGSDYVAYRVRPLPPGEPVTTPAKRPWWRPW